MADFCENCTHWYQALADPANLGAPRPGDCRGAPPQVVVLPGRSAHELQLRAMYPVVPGDYPACGRFEARPVPARNGVPAATGG